MASADDLSRDEWEAIMHAPFHAYVHVAKSEDAEPIAAQFRILIDEINAGQEHFPEGSLGRLLTSTLNANLDALWAGFQVSDRSARDGLTRARKVLDRADPGESATIRDWIVSLTVAVAQASRTIGTDVISDDETRAIADVAGWLDRPVPGLL